jgi:hypothetical protein
MTWNFPYPLDFLREQNSAAGHWVHQWPPHQFFVDLLSFCWTWFVNTTYKNWQIVEINPLKESCLCSTCKYFCFECQKKYQTTSICTMRLETVYKIYPRSCHLNGNSYSTRHAYPYIIYKNNKSFEHNIKVNAWEKSM